MLSWISESTFQSDLEPVWLVSLGRASNASIYCRVGSISLLGCCREDDRGTVLAHSSKETRAYLVSSYGLSHWREKREGRNLDGASGKLFSLNTVQCGTAFLAIEMISPGDDMDYARSTSSELRREASEAVRS